MVLKTALPDALTPYAKTTALPNLGPYAKTTEVTPLIDSKAPINNPTFTGKVSGITAEMVGLGNVNNTSDVDKPISFLTQKSINNLDNTLNTNLNQIAKEFSYLEKNKAPIQNPVFTGGDVRGITAEMVGLGKVNNTSDLEKPLSTAMTSALDLKAPLANPTFTGKVSGITAEMVGLGKVNDNITALSNKFADYYTKITIKSMLNRSIPVGTVIAYSASTLPVGFVLCNGAEYDRTGVFKKLFDVIGTIYGTPSSATKFKVPDIRSRTIIASDATKQLTSTGGSENTTLSIANMPSHNHDLTIDANTFPGFRAGVSNGGGRFDTTYTSDSLGAQSLGSHSHTGRIGFKGDGTPFNNMQPYITLNYIIKYDDASNINEPYENYQNKMTYYLGVF